MAPDQDRSGDLLGVLDGQRDMVAPADHSSAFAAGLDAALPLIAEESQVMTQGGGSAIAVREGDSMFCRARAGNIAPPLRSAINFTSGLTGESVHTGRVLVCADTETDARVDVEVCRLLGIRSLVVLPILLGGELAGIFEVFSPQPGAFGEGEVQALESMRELVVSVLRPVPEREEQAPAEGEAETSQDAPNELGRTLLGEESQANGFRNADPGDDLVCEVEARRAAGFRNDDPEDDLICEMGAPQSTPMPAFAVSVASPAVKEEEKKLPRVLVIAGVATLLLVLGWLNWCSPGLQRPVARHLPIAPKSSPPVRVSTPSKASPASFRRVQPQRVTATKQPQAPPGFTKSGNTVLQSVRAPEMPAQVGPPPVASVLREAPPQQPFLPATAAPGVYASPLPGAADSGIDVLQRAADKGDPQAQLALAVRYAYGDGVPQSYADALRWFSRAQSKGVLPRLPPAVEARERTEAWVVQQMARKP